MAMTWEKRGDWTGVGSGPTYGLDIAGGRRLVIWGRQTRCGEPGRRGYLKSYTVTVYQDGVLVGEVGQARDLARAKAIADRHAS